MLIMLLRLVPLQNYYCQTLKQSKAKLKLLGNVARIAFPVQRWFPDAVQCHSVHIGQKQTARCFKKKYLGADFLPLVLKCVVERYIPIIDWQRDTCSTNTDYQFFIQKALDRDVQIDSDSRIFENLRVNLRENIYLKL